MGKAGTKVLIRQRAIILIVALLVTVPLSAQENKTMHTVVDKLTSNIVDNTQEILKGTESFIERRLDEKDSLYVSPNIFNFTVMPQFSHNFEYYRFSSGEKEQSITLSPGFSNKLGLYFGNDIVPVFQSALINACIVFNAYGFCFRPVGQEEIHTAFSAAIVQNHILLTHQTAADQPLQNTVGSGLIGVMILVSTHIITACCSYLQLFIPGIFLVDHDSPLLLSAIFRLVQSSISAFRDWNQGENCTFSAP